MDQFTDMDGILTELETEFEDLQELRATTDPSDSTGTCVVGCTGGCTHSCPCSAE